MWQLRHSNIRSNVFEQTFERKDLDMTTKATFTPSENAASTAEGIKRDMQYLQTEALTRPEVWQLINTLRSFAMELEDLLDA